MKSMRRKVLPLCMLFALASCGGGNGGNNSTKPSSNGGNSSASTLQTYNYGEEQMYDNIWETKTVYNEPVVMIEDAEGNKYGNLLYTPTRIISVRNYTLQKEYAPSEYELKGNKLYMTASSTMPYLTQKNISCEEIPDLIGNKYDDGKGGSILFTEGTGIIMYQVEVTYEHNDTWTGTIPAKQGMNLPNFWNKINNNESIELVVNGDSIASGCNASSKLGIEPFQDDWPTGFANEITRKYNVSVNLHNTAVGGTLSDWGRKNVDSNVNHYDPDLVVIGFGMNDGSWNVSPQTYCDNIEFMIKSIQANNENAEIIVVATILANPASAQAAGRQEEYLVPLKTLCADYPGVVVMDMTTFSKDLYAKKSSFELLANNINHPNDFLVRAYVENLMNTIAK